MWGVWIRLGGYGRWGFADFVETSWLSLGIDSERGFVLGDDGGWGFGCRRMICRQWNSGDSTVACVRLCRSTNCCIASSRL